MYDRSFVIRVPRMHRKHDDAGCQGSAGCDLQRRKLLVYYSAVYADCRVSKMKLKSNGFKI